MLGDDLDPAFYAIVGEISHEWAALETLVNRCIWRAAQLDDQLGACATSQIFGLNAKLDTLVLLLRARGASERLIKDLRSFKDKARDPGEVRNRAVHDPVGVDRVGGGMQQLQISGKNGLVFELRGVTVDQMLIDRRRVNEIVDLFFEIDAAIISELETLPYTHQTIFPSIDRFHPENHRPSHKKPGSAPLARRRPSRE